MGAATVPATAARTIRNTDRVREILSWYESDNPGTKTNIARLLKGTESRLGKKD